MASAAEPDLQRSDGNRRGLRAAVPHGSVAGPIRQDLRGRLLGGDPAAGRPIDGQPAGRVPSSSDQVGLSPWRRWSRSPPPSSPWSPASGTSCGSPGWGCWQAGSWGWRCTRQATCAWNGIGSLRPRKATNPATPSHSLCRAYPVQAQRPATGELSRSARSGSWSLRLQPVQVTSGPWKPVESMSLLAFPAGIIEHMFDTDHVNRSLLLRGMRQSPPCQRVVPITLRAAVTDWLITTIASKESSQGRMRLPRMRQDSSR